MDGNNAAAHVSYAFTEVAGDLPHHPVQPHGRLCRPVGGRRARRTSSAPTVKVMEMQSEAGAAGTVHGSLAAGALTTTYTASQGLLLMIPNMYKIAGELLPARVPRVRPYGGHPRAVHLRRPLRRVWPAARPVSPCCAESERRRRSWTCPRWRTCAAIKGRVPFLNFFDGFRTSHEIQKIEVWDYDDLRRDGATWTRSTPSAARAQPRAAGHARQPPRTATSSSRHREACNNVLRCRCPAIVEDYMDKVNAKLGTELPAVQLLRRSRRRPRDRGHGLDLRRRRGGHRLPERRTGEKVGLVKVRLYRPFVPTSRFARRIPDDGRRTSPSWTAPRSRARWASRSTWTW